MSRTARFLPACSCPKKRKLFLPRAMTLSMIARTRGKSVKLAVKNAAHAGELHR
ncbi:Hypothetical protein A7982_06461 [Minicystis rosea]|nr:Hypothetical protein A7982_06461 [Minicystis rosea]